MDTAFGCFCEFDAAARYGIPEKIMTDHFFDASAFATAVPKTGSMVVFASVADYDQLAKGLACHVRELR